MPKKDSSRGKRTYSAIRSAFRGSEDKEKSKEKEDKEDGGGSSNLGSMISKGLKKLQKQGPKKKDY
jgi:hypothetical protein